MIELDIPMGFIDFRRMTFVRGAAGISLKADIEAWLADNGIACGVSVRKNGTGSRRNCGETITTPNRAE